jgi:soluble lytic murein transglycosylase-like protein
LADPATNLAAAALYLRDLHRQFGSMSLALRAYNSGPNGVDRSNPRATPAGTGDPTCVDKVLDFSRTIASGGELPA